MVSSDAGVVSTVVLVVVGVGHWKTGKWKELVDSNFFRLLCSRDLVKVKSVGCVKVVDAWG